MALDLAYSRWHLLSLILLAVDPLARVPSFTKSFMRSILMFFLFLFFYMLIYNLSSCVQQPYNRKPAAPPFVFHLFIASLK